MSMTAENILNGYAAYSTNVHILDKADQTLVSRRMAEVQQHSVSMPVDEVSISEEGLRALREKVKELTPETEEKFQNVEIQDTNEVEWEHYTAMREILGQALENREYDVKDVMKSVMDAYEPIYNKILEEHENGDRNVSYDLTGERSITLEEDLAGLDQAFQLCLKNLEGYITCQQTNQAFADPDTAWYFNRIGTRHLSENDSQPAMKEDYNYFDKSYQETVMEIMKQAREEFLLQLQKQGYQKGIASGIVSGLFEQNEEFMEKTQKLFD